MVYNILSCGGFDTGTAVGGIASVASMGCMKARIGIILLFFIIAIVRRWGGEEMGVGFSFLFALIFASVPYLIIITIFGSFQFAFAVGLLGGLIGGYGAGVFFGDDGGY